MEKTVVLLVCAILLCGCVKRIARVERPAAVSFVDVKLRDAAESISMDMAQLTGSAQNREMKGEKGAGDLYTKMDLTWDGPIEGALSRVASTSGFMLKVEGQAPHDPVMVHLKLVDRPCLAVLREIGLQTGPAEGIIVNEAARSITLRYLGQ